MLKDIKKTAKHSMIYALGNVGIKFVGFLLIPFYTNPEYLSTSEYGALAVLEATLQVLVGILSFALAGSMSRWFWDEKFKSEQKSIFFTSFLFLVVVVIPLIIGVAYFSDHFSFLLFKDISFDKVVKLTIYAAGFQILNNLVLTLLKLKSKSIFYVGTQIVKILVLLLYIIWGLKYKGLALTAVMEGYLYAEVATFIIFIPVIIRNSEVKLQWRVLKEMLNYGFPLMLASLSGVLLAVTDRYMLNSMEGLERTAVYSVGYRIANTLKMVVSMSLSLALLPLQMKKIGTEGSRRFYAKSMKYSSFLFSMALLALSLFSLELLKIITGSSIYWEAHGIVAITSFALLFGQLKNDTLIGITIEKKTKITGLLVFITSILNIGLNIILIPLWDIYGAAFATLFSQLFFFIAVYIVAQRIYFIPYEIKNTIILVLLLAGFVFIGILTAELNTGIRLLIKAILFIVFPFILWLFNYYDAIEKERLIQIFKTWKDIKSLPKNLKNFMK